MRVWMFVRLYWCTSDAPYVTIADDDPVDTTTTQSAVGADWMPVFVYLATPRDSTAVRQAGTASLSCRPRAH